MATRRSLFVVMALLLAGARSLVCAQTAGHVRFAGGTVSVVAENVPAVEILAEWTRAGTKVIGLERLTQRRITLNLVDVPEEQALQAIVGPGLTFAATPRSLASPGSRFLQVVILTAMHNPGGAGGNEQGPPEARFSYPAPGHAVSTSDVFLTDVLPAAPGGRGSMGDPETIYDYTGPREAKLKDAAGEFTARYAEPSPNDTRPTTDPETRFNYSTSRRAQEPAARPVPPAPARTAPAASDVEPETRFQYFVSGKAAPPKKSAPLLDPAEVPADAPPAAPAAGTAPDAKTSCTATVPKAPGGGAGATTPPCPATGKPPRASGSDR